MTSRDINTGMPNDTNNSKPANKSPPKEGSNRGQELGEHSRANICDTISTKSAYIHSHHVDDSQLDAKRPIKSPSARVRSIGLRLPRGS